MNRLDRLLQVLRKRRRLVAGLMSGTSVEGIDAALVEIEGSGEEGEVRLLAFRRFPFPAGVRRRIFGLFDPEQARIEEVCKLDFLVGELYAVAAKQLVRETSFGTADLDLIGTAGQTVWHDPEPVVAEVEVEWAGEILMTRSTLAIGQSAVIAERTGAITVGDLRVRDVAAGGQGAPLAAYADWALMRHSELGRCVQNLGGIGTVTYLPPGAVRREVLAFDTGPGNLIIDALAERASGGREQCDREGALAASGRVRPELLEAWMADPYFARRPPKTAGRECFGAQLAQETVASWPGLPLPDLVASATAFIAESVADAYRRFVLPRGPVHEVIVSGRGTHNPTLMTMLRERLSGFLVVPSEERGLDCDAREAVAIAVLANDTLRGVENNLTGATGGRPTILGKVSL